MPRSGPHPLRLRRGSPRVWQSLATSSVRSPGSRLATAGLNRLGKSPAAPDGGEAQRETGDEPSRAHEMRRELQQTSDDDYARAGERGDGVDVALQDSGDLGNEQVAHDASADPGGHPEDRRRHRTEVECERL